MWKKIAMKVVEWLALITIVVPVSVHGTKFEASVSNEGVKVTPITPLEQL